MKKVLTLLEAHTERFKLDTVSATTTQMAFVGQRTSTNNYKGKKRNGSSSFNSRGKGFTQGQSFGSKPWSKPLNSSFTRTDKGASSVPSQGSTKEEPSICQICNKHNHTALTCFNRFNHAFTPNDIPQALAAMTIADNQDSTWFPDTGATDHITGDPGKLQSLIPYHGTDGVMVGNGDNLQITHIRQATIGHGPSSIKLNDVLLVPDIKKDLLSVSQLTFAYPLLFEFNGDGFVIKDGTTHRIVATGSRRGGLYALDGGAAAFFSRRFRKINGDGWHQRLGHPQMRIVNHLRHQKLISFYSQNKSSKICTGCQMGKSSRLPFLSVDDSITSPFYKVHCDLWGPAPVRSKEQFQFYAVFIDDHTRFTWFYPMHRKSELFECFVHFQKFVTCQFNAKIRIF
jgi:hypothetical protein